MTPQRTIPTQSFASILEKYRKALCWLDTLGINYRSGRVQKYLRTFESWNRSYMAATSEESKEAFPSFIYSVQEIWAFIAIYDAFHNVPVQQLQGIIQKLKDGVKGPVNLADETPDSTRARNFIFEALMAAKSHRPAKKCTAILNAKTDTGIRYKNNKIWVECKRITTTKKIEKNIRVASKQLEEAISNQQGAGHRGIVSIDISKILNAGDRIFVATDSEKLLKEVDLMMNKFMYDYSELWQEIFKSKNRKIIGIIVKFSFMASSESEGLLSHCTQWAMNPRRNISQHDDTVLRELAAILKESSE